MKAVKVCHPSHFREVPEGEAERLLMQGWRLLADTQTVNANALKQRRHRRKRREGGYRRVSAYLSPELYEEFTRLKRPGENSDEFFARVMQLLRVLL